MQLQSTKFFILISCCYQHGCSDASIEYCSTPEMYTEANKISEKLLYFGMWSSNNCSCNRQCNQNIYMPYTETMEMGEEDAGIGKLRVYYQVLFIIKSSIPIRLINR